MALVGGGGLTTDPPPYEYVKIVILLQLLSCILIHQYTAYTLNLYTLTCNLTVTT